MTLHESLKISLAPARSSTYREIYWNNCCQSWRLWPQGYWTTTPLLQHRSPEGYGRKGTEQQHLFYSITVLKVMAAKVLNSNTSSTASQSWRLWPQRYWTTTPFPTSSQSWRLWPQRYWTTAPLPTASQSWRLWPQRYWTTTPLPTASQSWRLWPQRYRTTTPLLRHRSPEGYGRKGTEQQHLFYSIAVLKATSAKVQNNNTSSTASQSWRLRP